jgi:predicted HAD superfamily phosphohydrolase YqeG
VHVLRHGYKKPFVSEEVRREVEEWFGVGAGQLVMVGDRYMTDVVFGNRLGMMTVRVKPFVEVRGEKGRGEKGRRHTDPQSVRVSRRLEEALVRGFREML